MENFSLEFYNPDWKIFLLFVIIAMVLFISFRRTGNKKGALVVFGIRIGILLLSAFLFVKPVFKWEKQYTEKPIVELWVDNSKSIEKNESISTESYRSSIRKLAEFLSDNGIETKFEIFGSQAEDVNNVAKIDLSETATNFSQLFQRDKDVSGAILITDGQFNSGIDPYAMIFSNQYPVYCLGVGDTTRFLDAKVLRIEMPKKVKLDEKFSINAELSLPEAGEAYTLLLNRNGLEVDRKNVQSSGSGFLENIEFQQIAQKIGENEYAVTIEGPSDKNLHNNTQSSLLNVLPRKKNILVVCSGPSFETRALMNVLRGNDDFSPSIIYKKNGDWMPDSKILNKEFDFVIYVDYPEKDIETTLLSKFSQRPALFFIDRNTDVASINENFNETIIQKFSYKKNNAIKIEESVIGKGFPITRDIDDGTDWEKLPPVNTDFKQLKLSNALQTILETSGKNSQPVFAIGEQCALLIGSDFWRWKNMTDSQNYSQLIINTIKYLTEKNDYSNVQIATNKKLYLQGETAEFFGTVYDLKGNSIPTADVQVEILKDSLLVDDFYLNWKNDQFFGQYTFSGHGNFHIRIFASKENSVIGERKFEVKVDNREQEYLETGLDDAVLKFIANENNGDYYPLNHYKELVGTIDNKSITKNQSSSIEFHKNMIVFLFLILLLISEWIVRKYFGFL